MDVVILVCLFNNLYDGEGGGGLMENASFLFYAYLDIIHVDIGPGTITSIGLPASSSQKEYMFNNIS